MTTTSWLHYFVNGTRIPCDMSWVLYTLPLYWSVQCGHDGHARFSDEPIESLPYPWELLWNTSRDGYFFMQTQWRSMEPDVPEWSLVLIKSRDGSYDEWAHVLVIHNDIPKLKKLIRLTNKWYLKSINKDFDPMEILPADEIQTIWYVKKIVKEF